MEPQAPATPPATSQPSEPSQTQPPQPVSSLPPSSSLIPSISAPLNPTPNPNSIQNQNQNQNQIPNSKPPTPLPHPSAQTPPQPRPPTTFNRNLPSQSQQQSPYSHFSSSLSSLPPSSAPASSGSSFTSTGSPSISGAPAPRGAMAIGVPAHHQIQSPPFSTSFGQHFGGLGRTGVNVPDPASNSNHAQVRAPMQGMGMLGSLGSNSQMRPGVIPAHQQRPVQSSLRSPSAQNNQSSGSQVHGLMRAPSVGSPALPSPSASQSLSQPWLSSGSPGKPPLPSPSYRQQLNSQSLQQRSHISPQLHSTATVSQQQQQLQPSPSYQSQEHFGQQVPPSRALHVPHQQQVMRVQGPGNQKPAPLLAAQPSAVQPGTQNRLANPDTDETCNRILSKRTIHELVNQVDPLEKLDPEVEEILMDVAENFFESITRSGCSLAIHRKSTTLEAKDILLHLEKTWNITLPGFGGDEIKSYRRQLTSDIHKDRLTVIRKSMVTTEAAQSKGSAGQASGSAKGTLAKTHLNVIGSPNLKNS